MGGTVAARAASSSVRSRRPPTASNGRSSRGEQVVVGVNRFRDDEVTTHRIDPDGERRQVERVGAERSAEAWATPMDGLRRLLVAT